VRLIVRAEGIGQRAKVKGKGEREKEKGKRAKTP
jgi:hypothetical protein